MTPILVALVTGGFLAALDVLFRKRQEPPPAIADEQERLRFGRGLERLAGILKWLESRAAVAAMAAREAEAVLVVTESATFEARNRQILVAYESNTRVSLADSDLNCVADVMKNCIGEDREDSVVQLVALDTLFTGFCVSNETYGLNASAYSRFVELIGGFMQGHSTLFTHQMRRTLTCIAEDLGDAGLAGPATYLKESLRSANQARRDAQRIRCLKEAERSVPAFTRSELGEVLDLETMDQSASGAATIN